MKRDCNGGAVETHLSSLLKHQPVSFEVVYGGGNHDADCENEANHNENKMKSSIMN